MLMKSYFSRTHSGDEETESRQAFRLKLIESIKDAISKSFTHPRHENIKYNNPDQPVDRLWLLY